MKQSLDPAAYDAYVGIDVGATSAVAVGQRREGTTQPSLSFHPQQPLNSLLSYLRALEAAPSRCLIVVEATGSYWMRLVTQLSQLGYGVSVINPQQAHHFAKAYLKHTKTDQIDARTLLKLAITFQPAVWQPPPALYTELAQRLNQRDDLLKVRQQLSNQRHALLQQPMVVEAVRLRLELLLETLDSQLATIERELRDVLLHDEVWAEAARRLQTIPGIGLLTAVTLLVTTLAFTSCSSVDEATAYAGLAPHRRDSGSSIRGHLPVARHGNKQLRTALYRSTLSAARFNPLIKPFYDRLRAAGKPPKVARCAAARKLLHLAYAVVTKERDFDPARAPAAKLPSTQT